MERRCSFLPAKEVFPDLGPENDCFAKHDYLITSVLQSGREVKTAMLGGGPDGGFAEARPFTIANVFLCLREREHYKNKEPLRRASAALNNVLDLYRFVTLDPHARAVRSDLDTYYSLVSVADVPPGFGDIAAKDLLLRAGELKFGSTIGVDRTHHIGANSYDDLLSGDVLPNDTLNLLVGLSAAHQELEVSHQLSSRRLGGSSATSRLSQSWMPSPVSRASSRRFLMTSC